MSAFEGKVAWITGGGSGIGLACALEFARQGALVAVSGRRIERLEIACDAIREVGSAAFAVPCDVSDEPANRAAVNTIVRRFGRLDVCLANAGFSVMGKVEDLTDDDWRRQFDVNVFGLLHTVRAAMPLLKETGGRVALVGSVSSYFFTPRGAAYCASKAAVRAIGESLSHELVGTGVSCTTLHPGFVDSEIARVDNTGIYHPEKRDPRPKILRWSADRAARVMVRAIRRRQRECVFTGHGKAAVAMSRFLPGLTRIIAGRT